MLKTFLTKNSFQTKKIGENLAKGILANQIKKSSKRALILGLIGDLGGGKTTFLQGFAKGLGIKSRITSPTFIIMKRLKIKNCKLKIKNLYHIDCYRIRNHREILDLGFRKIISNPQNVIAIEWADKIKKILPKNSIILNFEFINKKQRKIILKNSLLNLVLEKTSKR